MNATGQNPPTPKPRREKKEGGYVIVLTALLSVPLLLAVGFSTDIGAWYARATTQQRAADAAALAGVVWLPNVPKATQVALDTAKRNGFDDADPDVEVIVEQVNPQQLRVYIKAPADIFFTSWVLEDLDIERESIAEYILPVPLGSPRNYLGTGTIASGSWEENVWLSEMGYCTAAEQGDNRATRYTGTSCSGTTNPEYTVPNYEFYIELPESRPDDVDVILYSAAYDSGDTEVQDAEYGQTQGPPTISYDLYVADDTPLVDTDNELAADEGICSSGNGSDTFAPGDYDEGYPWDPANTDYEDANRDWHLLCRIGPNELGGRYILRVNNNAGTAEGRNQFAVAATYQGDAPGVDPELCDSRTDSNCPRVYAKDALGYYLNNQSSSAEFFLAEINSDHAGKTVVVTLFDPAEGTDEIEILSPVAGQCDGWTEQTFDYTATNGNSGTGVSVLNTPDQTYNDETVTITWDLPSDWDPATCNSWFKVRYTDTSLTCGGPGQPRCITDRTTWGVNLIGDPVHLID